MSRRTLLGLYTETDAVTLTSIIAGQIDSRFIQLDLSQGSRIYWGEVCQKMSEVTGRKWRETECQRLWRYCAYGEDIGLQTDVLPDSDGEDDALKGMSFAGCLPRHLTHSAHLLPFFSSPCTRTPTSFLIKSSRSQSTEPPCGESP